MSYDSMLTINSEHPLLYA